MDTFCRCRFFAFLVAGKSFHKSDALFTFIKALKKYSKPVLELKTIYSPTAHMLLP